MQAADNPTLSEGQLGKGSLAMEVHPDKARRRLPDPKNHEFPGIPDLVEQVAR